VSGDLINYSDSELVSFCFFPQILSTLDKPKQPNANNATASTNSLEGAKCDSLKLFWYNVTVKEIVHNKPQRRFMEITPCSSENKLLIPANSLFIIW